MPDRYTAEELDALSRGLHTHLGVDRATAEAVAETVSSADVGTLLAALADRDARIAAASGSNEEKRCECGEKQ